MTEPVLQSSLRNDPLNRFLEFGVRAGRRISRREVRTVIASLLFAANCLLLVVFLFSSYKGFFHTDSAVRILLAQEMQDTGSFFPPGWNYVNKDLMVLFAQLGAWPLVHFGKASYTVFAITGVGVSAIILASVWWFTGLLGVSKWQRLLALAVLAGGVSMRIEEDVFGQAAYGMLLMFTCLIAVIAWRSISAPAAESWIWLGLLGVLVALCAWSNPQRAVASYLLPLYCGLAVYVWGAGWRRRVESGIPVVIVTLLGFVLGAVLSIWTLAHVNNNISVGAARWLDFNAMAANLVHTARGLLALLGGIPASGGDVTSAAGVYSALRMFVALILLVMMVRRVATLLRSGCERDRFVGGLVACVGVCFLFLHVTTTVADMSDPLSVSRYLAPAVILGILLVVCSPLPSESRFGGVLVIVVSLVLATSSMVRFNPGSLVNSSWKNAQRDALVADLKSMGLRYGYASYWNSGALTVLSGGDLKVRQVEFSSGVPLPMRHLSSDNWYEAEAWKGESFLLLTDAEVASVNWGELTRYVGQPIREARIGDFRVFVFGQNIAADMPGWSTKLRKPLSIEAAPDGLKTVGRWEEARAAVQAKSGEAGYLQYGPYVLLGPGRYTASFTVSAFSEAPHGTLGTVDVVAAGGTHVLATAEIMPGVKRNVVVDFDIDARLPNVELRVFANGSGVVDFHGVRLSTRP